MIPICFFFFFVCSSWQRLDYFLTSPRAWVKFTETRLQKRTLKLWTGSLKSKGIQINRHYCVRKTMFSINMDYHTWHSESPIRISARRLWSLSLIIQLKECLQDWTVQKSFCGNEQKKRLSSIHTQSGTGHITSLCKILQGSVTTIIWPSKAIEKEALSVSLQIPILFTLSDFVALSPELDCPFQLSCGDSILNGASVPIIGNRHCKLDGANILTLHARSLGK